MVYCLNALLIVLLTLSVQLQAAFCSDYNFEEEQMSLVLICLTSAGDDGKSSQMLVQELEKICERAKKENRLKDLLETEVLFSSLNSKCSNVITGESSYRKYLKKRVFIADLHKKPKCLESSEYLSNYPSVIFEISKPGILHLAAAHAPWEVVEYLINQGMNPKKLDSTGKNPMLYAQVFQRPDNQKILFARMNAAIS
ncbi:hypothetical protein JKY79_00655 [Candidatus Babeliales bacterium]|nr:hypothetical protein [Candidatus Babeliales bacterium]